MSIKRDQTHHIITAFGEIRDDSRFYLFIRKNILMIKQLINKYNMCQFRKLITSTWGSAIEPAVK